MLKDSAQTTYSALISAGNTSVLLVSRTLGRTLRLFCKEGARVACRGAGPERPAGRGVAAGMGNLNRRTEAFEGIPSQVIDGPYQRYVRCLGET